MCMRISLTKLLTTRFHSYTYVKRVSSNFKDKIFFPDILSNIGSNDYTRIILLPSNIFDYVKSYNVDKLN